MGLLLLISLTKSENLADQTVQCDLIYEIGVEGLKRDPNSSRLSLDLNSALSDCMKKITNEILEFDSKRKEFVQLLTDLDKQLTDLEVKKSSSDGLFKFITINTKKGSVKLEKSKLTNSQLDELKDKLDEQMVDLSKAFLNEKIDLLFEHKSNVEKLNEEIKRLKTVIQKNVFESIRKSVRFREETNENVEIKNVETKTQAKEKSSTETMDSDTQTYWGLLKMVDSVAQTNLSSFEMSDASTQTFSSSVTKADSASQTYLAMNNFKSLDEKLSGDLTVESKKVDLNLFEIDCQNDRLEKALTSTTSNEEESAKEETNNQSLVEKNLQLEQMVYELKFIIAKMYEKICDKSDF